MRKTNPNIRKLVGVLNAYNSPKIKQEEFSKRLAELNKTYLQLALEVIKNSNYEPDKTGKWVKAA